MANPCVKLWHFNCNQGFFFNQTDLWCFWSTIALHWTRLGMPQNNLPPPYIAEIFSLDLHRSHELPRRRGCPRISTNPRNSHMAGLKGPDSPSHESQLPSPDFRLLSPDFLQWYKAQTLYLNLVTQGNNLTGIASQLAKYFGPNCDRKVSSHRQKLLYIISAGT